MFGPIIPTLNVKSMDASLAFYVDRLGFNVKWSWADDGGFESDATPTFACVEKDQAILFLSVNDGAAHAASFIELPYVEDVQRLADDLTKSIALARAPMEMPWGSLEFTVEDPDNHTIRFSCPTTRTKTA